MRACHGSRTGVLLHMMQLEKCVVATACLFCTSLVRKPACCLCFPYTALQACMAVAGGFCCCCRLCRGGGGSAAVHGGLPQAGAGQDCRAAPGCGHNAHDQPRAGPERGTGLLQLVSMPRDCFILQIGIASSTARTAWPNAGVLGGLSCWRLQGCFDMVGYSQGRVQADRVSGCCSVFQACHLQDCVFASTRERGRKGATACEVHNHLVHIPQG